MIRAPFLVVGFFEIIFTINNLFIIEFLVDSFTFNGTKYNIGDFIIENAEVAAKITGMYVSEMNDLAVVSCDIHTIVFDNNLLFYEVRERIGNEVDLIINIPDCPTSIHKSGRRKYLKKLL